MSEWIRFSDHKPEVGQPILIYSPDICAATSVIFGRGASYCGEVVYYPDLGVNCLECVSGIEITHWMPLPELPEEE